MAPAVENTDDMPTEVLSREDELFAGLEVPDYSDAPEPSPAPVAATVRRGPGPGLWAAFIVAAIAAIGVAIWLFLPRGPAVVNVPDVRGLTLNQAQSELSDAGLAVAALTDEAFDEEIPVGLVVGTTPEAELEVVEGTDITIVVSIGIEPTELPALVGLSLSEATSRLGDARLELGEVRYEYSETADKDAVLEITDADGAAVAPATELEPGAIINLVVSAGALPEVTGLTVEESEALLSDAGLIGVVGGDGQFSDTIAEGLVIDYVRPQGIMLRPGDTVTITVSRGPELIAIPDLVGDTIQDAVDTLKGLGLTVEVRSEYPESAWDEPFARVTSVEPAEGQQVPLGTLVIIRSFV